MPGDIRPTISFARPLDRELSTAAVVAVTVSVAGDRCCCSVDDVAAADRYLSARWCQSAVLTSLIWHSTLSSIAWRPTVLVVRFSWERRRRRIDLFAWWARRLGRTCQDIENTRRRRQQLQQQQQPIEHGKCTVYTTACGRCRGIHKDAVRRSDKQRPSTIEYRRAWTARVESDEAAVVCGRASGGKNRSVINRHS